MSVAAQRELEIALIEHKLKQISPELNAAAERVLAKMFATDQKHKDENFAAVFAMIGSKLEQMQKELEEARATKLHLESNRTASRLDGEGLRPVTEYHSVYDVDAWSQFTERLHQEDPQAVLEVYRRELHAAARRKQQEAKQPLQPQTSAEDSQAQSQPQQDEPDNFDQPPSEVFDAAEFDRILAGGRRVRTPPSYPPPPVRSSSPPLATRSSAPQIWTRSSEPAGPSARAAERVPSSSGALVPTMRKNTSQRSFRQWTSIPKRPSDFSEPGAAPHDSIPPLQPHVSLPEGGTSMRTRRMSESVPSALIPVDQVFSLPSLQRRQSHTGVVPPSTPSLPAAAKAPRPLKAVAEKKAGLWKR